MAADPVALPAPDDAVDDAVAGAPGPTLLERRLGERGASLVEYALLVALIAVVAIGAVTVFGGAVDSAIGSGASGLMDAGN